jgi:hypothetical protein
VAEEVEGAEDEAFEEYIGLWNRSSNSAIRQQLTALVPEYVSITMSSVYEDKCLITAANPELSLASHSLRATLRAELRIQLRKAVRLRLCLRA